MKKQRLWLVEERRDFKQEIHWIATTLGISARRIEIDAEHPVGEDVIFIDGVYNGYLDQQFYDYMTHGVDEYGDYADWIASWKNKTNGGK